MNRPVLPPATATVACQNSLHRLGWADGVLWAVDHDDIDGELVLGALDGEAAPCAQIIDAWRQAADDARVLVLASRGPVDPLSATDDPLWPASVPSGPPASASFGWYAYNPLPGSARPGRHRPGHPGSGKPDTEQLLGALLTLGGGLPERLVATVVAGWADHLAAGTAPAAAVPALTAALTSRATAAVRQWAHNPTAEVAVTMLPPGSTGTLETVGDRVTLALPFSWLADVWVPGLAVLLDRFTLGVAADSRRLVLDTISPRGDRRPVLITTAD